MDDEERALLAATVAQALAGRRGADGDDVLAELGWRDLLAAEPDVAVAVVFDALGAGAVRASCLLDVVAAAAGLDAAAPPVVLPAFGSARPPGRVVEGSLAVEGIALAAAAGAPRLTVVAGDGDRAWATEADAAELAVDPVEGVDATLGLATVRGRLEVPAEPRRRSVDWPAAVDAGRLAVAHELAGVSRTMLTLAVEHARERVQFGRPIGAFQAIRHRLADVLVAVESADAALVAAHEVRSSLAAALAKALAGRAASTAAVHCQQVLAGIGFTLEHEFHRFLLRSLALDGLFGSTTAITREIGAGLLQQRSVPRVIEL